MRRPSKKSWPTFISVGLLACCTTLLAIIGLTITSDSQAPQTPYVPQSPSHHSFASLPLPILKVHGCHARRHPRSPPKPPNPNPRPSRTRQSHRQRPSARFLRPTTPSFRECDLQGGHEIESGFTARTCACCAEGRCVWGVVYSERFVLSSFCLCSIGEMILS